MAMIVLDKPCFELTYPKHDSNPGYTCHAVDEAALERIRHTDGINGAPEPTVTRLAEPCVERISCDSSDCDAEMDDDDTGPQHIVQSELDEVLSANGWMETEYQQLQCPDCAPTPVAGQQPITSALAEEE